jgi:hypothetical protein
MVKKLFFTALALTVTVSLGRMSLEHLQLYGLIIAIPVAVYASYLVLTLERER